MKLLWLTLADPDPPTNGQFLYSAGLIEATLSAGAEVEVVGFDRPEARHRDGYRSERVAWSLAAHRPRSRWRGLIARAPYFSFRTMTSDMRRRVSGAVARAGWDAIVFDSCALGWALPVVLRRYRDVAARSRLVYIAHNHETTISRIFARDETRPLHRLVKRIDALRVARQERALVNAADLITSNTPEDCARFDAMRTAGKTMFLPPGYGGPRTDTRKITATLPRRAVIVGTFDWPTKRESLEAFLTTADRQFAAAGIELLVVGNAEVPYLDRLRRTVTATRFTGRVDNIRPYLRDVRLALVPDMLGGFKLKTLDYVFNRLPILAISNAVPGLPLKHGESILLADDHAALTRLVLDAIDNVELLDHIQDKAYDACEDCFEWSAIGARLLRGIEQADSSAPFPDSPHSFANHQPQGEQAGARA